MTTTQHPFVSRPHHTLLALMFPVLLSLVAEPITGLVDTGFVARLGTDPLAALGIATTALSSMFWVFNFLTVGTQTQISQAAGAGRSADTRSLTSLALIVGWVLSAVVMVVFLPLAGVVSGLLGGEGAVREAATVYTRIRLLGTPAVFTMLVCFGVLRGDQDMRTPSVFAVLLNVINIVLDYPFIFGFGVIPGMGVAGAALASTISQYIGAALALTFTLQRYGFTTQIDMDDMHALFQIGGNMFLRTSFLMLFLIVSTRVANVAGAESGAAHQVIRQIYVVTALSLDAFAVSTQSLVGYFLGADDRVHARQAAVISIGWSVATGIAMTVLMLLVTTPLLRLMVPDEAIAIFIPAWIISAVAQPVNAVSFSTDGIHMGSGDYGFLRNAMFISTVGGIIALLMINPEAIHALSYVWLATTLWVTLRAIAGLARIFVPEFNAPLAAPVQN